MTSHLVVKYDGEEMALSPDASVDIEDKNPLFHDTELFSYPMALPLEQNRHVLGNVDDVNAERRAVELEHKQMDIIAEGLPLRSGVASIQADEVIKDTLSMNIDERTLSFDDLIGDLKCQDVPLKDEIIVGEKIANVQVDATYGVEVVIGLGNGAYADTGLLENNRVNCTFEPQALGFSYPGKCAEDSNGVATRKNIRTYPDGTEVTIPKEANGRSLSTYINVNAEYGNTEGSPHKDKNGSTIGWPYCNARVCYKHHGKNDDGTTSDAVAEPTSKPLYEDHWPYWVLDADRPTSGLCFYVLYFLDCLFAHLGVTFDNTALTAIPDLKRLVFFTTKCKYSTTDSDGDTHVLRHLSSLSAINTWLKSRGCGGQLEFDPREERELESYKFTGTINIEVSPGHVEIPISNKTFVKGQPSPIPYGSGTVDWIKTLPHNDAGDDAAEWFTGTCQADVVNMYATSENFPDETVKTVLDSLQNSFGIRFNYDYQANKVTAYLMRDVFRQGSTNEPRTFFGNVHTIHPLTEKITGVRVKYSAEGEASEQQRNVRTGKRDYDTEFDYIDYREGNVNVDKTYAQIFTNIWNQDMTCYVDLTTGNAYRIKVDKDATTAEEWHPVLFEVGQYKGVEIGDCSLTAEKEGTIREFVSDFQPVSFNDVNYQTERQAIDLSGTARQGTRNASYSASMSAGNPILAAFVDEDMEHEFVESRIRTAVTPALVDIYISQVLKLVESYDPTSTDNGDSPLQSYDWGLAVALMRGGGSDATVQQYAFGYDGFGNDKWRTVAGEYVMASDTMDAMGNQFDYNGTSPGLGDADRFSLKIRAWKPFVYYKDANGKLHLSLDTSLAGQAVDGQTGKQWLIPCAEDQHSQSGSLEYLIRRRGTFDVFMSENAYFLLRRHPYRITLDTTVAQLIDVKSHWSERWRVAGKIGYIDRLQYNVSAETGLGEVTMDFYAI